MKIFRLGYDVSMEGDSSGNLLLETTSLPGTTTRSKSSKRQADELNNDPSMDKSSEKAAKNVKLTESENRSSETVPNENDIYSIDQGPFVVYMEYVTQNDKPISDIKIGKLMGHKRVKDIIETKRIGRNRVKLSFAKRESANMVLKDKSLVADNLKAFIPSHLIQRIGIIKFIDEELTNTEIQDNIIAKNIKVKEASRFIKTIRNPDDSSKDKKIPTGTVKITFTGQLLPETIDLYGVKRKVSPYYFTVTQCFGCYRFGHTQKNCRAKKKCRVCGETIDGATHDKCQNKVKCVNCNKDHSSTDKQCEERIRQDIIKRIMVDENISFFEANEKFPRVSNRFDILENLGEFPELPTNKNYHRVLENHRENTYQMYNNYKQRKIVNNNSLVDNRRFSHLFVQEEIVPSSPILNNPYKVLEFERFRNELKDIKAVFDSFCKNDMNRNNPANNDLALMEIGERINNLVQVCIEVDKTNLAKQSTKPISENNKNSELPSSDGPATYND